VADTASANDILLKMSFWHCVAEASAARLFVEVRLLRLSLLKRMCHDARFLSKRAPRTEEKVQRIRAAAPGRPGIETEAFS